MHSNTTVHHIVRIQAAKVRHYDKGYSVREIEFIDRDGNTHSVSAFSDGHQCAIDISELEKDDTLEWSKDNGQD